MQLWWKNKLFTLDGTSVFNWSWTRVPVAHAPLVFSKQLS